MCMIPFQGGFTIQHNEFLFFWLLLNIIFDSKIIIQSYYIFSLLLGLNTDDEFEKSLQSSVQATIIAGDALNALQPVELHAVTLSNNYTGDFNHHSTITTAATTTTTLPRVVSQYERPFTPDFSSITSGASSMTNTPLKDETNSESAVNISSILTDASFSSAVSTQAGDTEETPTNKNNITVNITEKTPTNNGSMFGDDASNITPMPNPNSSFTATPVNQHQQSNTPVPNNSLNTNATKPPSKKTPSLKLFSEVNESRNTSSGMNTPPRGFKDSAFMQDCGDSLSDDDDFGDFDTADGGFEELLT